MSRTITRICSGFHTKSLPLCGASSCILAFWIRNGTSSRQPGVLCPAQGCPSRGQNGDESHLPPFTRPSALAWGLSLLHFLLSVMVVCGLASTLATSMTNSLLLLSSDSFQTVLPIQPPLCSAHGADQWRVFDEVSVELRFWKLFPIGCALKVS